MNLIFPPLYRKSVLMLAFTLFITSLSAQRGGRSGGRAGAPEITVKGLVLDAESQTPLEFATISIFSKKDSSLITGGLTEPDGTFAIKAKVGQMYAILEYISYEAQTIDVVLDREAIKAGNPSIDLGTINLAISGIALDNIEIRAEKSETQFSLDKRVFNVGKDLANQGGSAQDILDNVPSVTVDIEGAVSLRGSEGVRILIDGKPSGLANQDNANGLRSIPANLISSVEVITNPSARYEAEGMAGIINIVLKKDKGSGFNGSFDVSAGYPEQAGLGANLNYRKGKVNWFANYGLRRRTGPGNGRSFLEQQRGSETFFQETIRNNERSSVSNSIRFGIDYLKSDKETLTGAFLYRRSDEDNFGSVEYKDYLNNFPSNLLLSTLRTDDEREDESNLEYSVNYKREFSSRKHTLEATVQYQDNIEDEGSDFLEQSDVFVGDEIPDLVQRSGNEESNKQWLFQLDFNKPIGKDGKFEIGARSSLRGINNDYLVEQKEDGTFQKLAGLSNNFNYDENVHAVYSIYGNKASKFSYQFGLRSEYSDILTELLETNEVNDRNYFNFFPSAFFNYEITEGSTVQTNYSRRIRRPRFWDLNPFFTFSDSRNTFSGNPNLDPEFTDSYEINYIKYADDLTISGGVFYRHTKDVIQRILLFNDDGTTNRIPQNLATGDDYGVELTMQYSGLKWLRLNGSANFFKQKVNGQNVDNSFQSNTSTWNTRWTTRFTFWKGSDLQLRFNYRAPRETVQGSSNAIASLDIGWSKDVMGKSGTLTLSVRDVFNSRRRKGVTIGENFYRESEFRWRARTATLSFNYRINQKKKRGGRPSGGEFEGGGGEF